MNNQQGISNLEKAAEILMAPPNLVSSEQRHGAESIFLDFRKTKNPYAVCREILESCHNTYVQFEAADLLKNAIIREWSFLQESDIQSLRQYLMHYIVGRECPAFVQDRLLQVFAIIVKRQSIDDFGKDRFEVLNDVKDLITKSDHSKRIIGFKIIYSLMQEYATTVKSTDVGLPWELHFKAKKHFEATDLKRIFSFCIQVLTEFIQGDINDKLVVMKYVLLIIENILTWGYISPMLPKRIIGVYETVYEADQAPALRLTRDWKETILEPQMLAVIFATFLKVRDFENLAPHALTCMVQLASLNGGITSLEDVKLKYLTIYIEHFLKLLSIISIRAKEAISFSDIVRKLELFYAPDLTKLDKGIQDSYLDEVTRMTVYFSKESIIEDIGSEENQFMIAFDNILEAWTTILHDFNESAETTLISSATSIFNTYLEAHLSPPEGTRVLRDNHADEIEDNEDNDRIKYKEQLQVIGICGRLIPNHALYLLHRFLQDRTNKLKEHLSKMQSQAMTINDSFMLQNIFEDIHWIVLVSGHVLCMDSDGETPLIPTEIMQFSISQHNKRESTLEGTLATLASAHQLGELPSAIDQCDSTIKIFRDVLQLCSIENTAAEAKLGMFMSPEVGCTLMWFLKRFFLSYLLPNEVLYHEISPLLVGSLGKDTEGAEFVVNFVLGKIQSNICHFYSEPVLLQDTADLFIEIVGVKQKSNFIVKTDGLWSLVELQLKLGAGVLPQNIRRSLYKAFVMAGNCLKNEDVLLYFQRVLNPVQTRFDTLVLQKDIKQIYKEDSVQTELQDILECYIGIAMGAQMNTVTTLFNFLAPTLTKLPTLLQLCHNYEIIVQSIFDLFKQCTSYMLCYLTAEDSVRLYESTLMIIQEYSKCNVNRFSSEALSEDGKVQDLILIIDILTGVLSKDCLDLCPISQERDQNQISAAAVTLFGLNFIMPLMTIDMLKYPNLCCLYYRLLVLVDDIYPEHLCELSEELLTSLLASIEMGLRQFSSEIVVACLDFLQGLATYIFRHKLENSKIYHMLMPFLKLLMDLTLSHQINTDVMSTASTAIFALMCCYQEQYQQLVNTLIQTQTDPMIAERLSVAFTSLTQNIPLTCERMPKLKFRDNFDKFISNVHGFLLVK